MIDWGYLAQGPCYPAAVWNCRTAGKCASKLVEAIHKVSDAHMHVIGFSLGAHVSGYISNYLTGKTIDRITGLDPALPGFTTVPPDKKLDRSDAKFVDVIHTNAFMEGNFQQLGDIDFYINGGIVQPGCTVFRNQFNFLELISCSHHLSLNYFGESINTAIGFWGSYCNSYFHYLISQCTDYDNLELMGEYVNQKKRGTYIVYTNPSPPYAKGFTTA
ncbi:hypothetical protein FQR65_LT07140 [Abscondita terminalis]|nr:hypothetical protein FQR65_LT07140 [Abscondita terminalis]